MSREWPPKPFLSKPGQPPPLGALAWGPYLCGFVAFAWVVYCDTDSLLQFPYIAGSVMVPLFLVGFVEGIVTRLAQHFRKDGAPPPKPDVTSKDENDHDT